VHVHPARLIVALGLVIGCRNQSVAVPTAAPTLQAPTDLCRARARCSISRQFIADAPGVALVAVRLAHAPDAGTDEEHCDRREYWLSRPTGDLLVAVDCQVQWGADNAGPATVKVKGTRLEVSYTELQSSDACENYSATVSVVGPKLVEAQSRVVGTVVKNVCQPSRATAPLAPVGDGSPAHPLLTLNR
jgi:hypothetical protein